MMDQNLEYLLKDLTLDQLVKSPVGAKLQQAAEIFQTVQDHYIALFEKQSEMGMTGIKVITLLSFGILRKIADGKVPSALDTQDWKEIAAVVSEYAVLADDQRYSVFIFGLYERYIRVSVAQIIKLIPEKTALAINALADELHFKTASLCDGHISEAAYTEDCLWISLEAMIKLLASTTALSGDNRLTDFAQALASYAFEYGRLMLYRRELEITNLYIESQYQLDAELERKYTAYLDDLKKESEQFYLLVDNAFAPDFRDAFLHSILLAKATGVKETEILSSTVEIDDFFLN